MLDATDVVVNKSDLPMRALYSEKTMPASVAGAITAAGAGSAGIVSTTFNTLVPFSGSRFSPMPPPDLAAVPFRLIWSGLAIDAFVFGGALLLLRWLLTAPGRALREMSRMWHGHCITCGYDLGYDFVPGCPKCGWRRGPGRSGPPV